ncbi:hypothetical protein R3P38DRAFT_3169519 [Favolaschia claudopus]|uniref:Uncharacterized protein n=1 Tax=Favolaschia claudopus TaxID=2862362 RepID=A0AAW0E501_9AGAR
MALYLTQNFRRSIRYPNFRPKIALYDKAVVLDHALLLRVSPLRLLFTPSRSLVSALARRRAPSRRLNSSNASSHHPTTTPTHPPSANGVSLSPLTPHHNHLHPLPTHWRWIPSRPVDLCLPSTPSHTTSSSSVLASTTPAAPPTPLPASAAHEAPTEAYMFTDK